MRVNVKKENGYNIHTIKLDKYKTTTMNIIFRKELKKEDISSYVILSRLMTESSKKYPSKKSINIELERLYNSFIIANVSIEGNSLCFEITYDFINPKYCEEGYLEQAMKFPFELLYNPNIVNGKFEEKSYNNAINFFKTMLEEEKEYAAGYSMKRSLECMDSSSPTSYSSVGYLEDLEWITSKTLVNSYKRLFKDFNVDIYVVGNIDMDLVTNYIEKYIKLDNKVKPVDNLYIVNKLKKQYEDIVEYGEYEQASLVMLYNMQPLTKRERDVVLPVFNSILGGNNLTSKLYMNVREKNSLCYNIGSYFIKFSSLLIVRAGIDSKNKDKTVKLVNKCIKEMVNGEFSDEEVLSAKKARINQVRMQEDSTWSILAIQVAADIDNIATGNKMINEIRTVTKKEIIDLAKKIKLNTIYLLCKEEDDGRN